LIDSYLWCEFLCDDISDLILVTLYNTVFLILYHLTQVTAGSLRLVDAKTRRQLTEWKAPAPMTINVATANASQVCPDIYFKTIYDMKSNLHDVMN